MQNNFFMILLSMTTIENGEETIIEIKKSKFISKAFCVNSQEEINEKLIEMKNLYSGFTHCCYAYKVNDLEFCSDDGEPSGTAGYPILNIIQKNNLTNVLIVVIRYFGGIKLGAGPLLRAYSNSAIEAIKNATLKTLKNKCEFCFDVEFGTEFKVYSMQKSGIFDIKNAENNHFVVLCDEKNKNEFLNFLKNLNAKNVVISEVLL